MFPQVRFDAVQVLDLPQEPTAGARGLFEGVVELSSHMSPAARQSNGSGVGADKGRVGRVAIALNDPSEV
jgi:hypothetical protein